MITIRKFIDSDVDTVANLVALTLRTTNAKDYSSDYLENDIKLMDASFFIKKARETHFYVFLDGSIIVGVGAIGSYWGRKDESSLFDIFVLPDYQGRGIGRKIIQTLESDPYFLRADRVEIPASITAVPFYQKMGYQYKNHEAKLDQERLYRLEKFPTH